ncbi:protein CURVATURE THYLAKOID 1C, chloroplastic [Oryza brachyantha]|uniref:Cyanobacterial aminoacyl-tRNA synthetase CAAD domain-containing protein n=1 Tax=Oryza brachyantha TaxID=4533 RepID=J3L4B1_ORYBR|nr:protein CURVATURE THYLAKOID 1C, chloroplastic [Oryza brachyantha]
MTVSALSVARPAALSLRGGGKSVPGSLPRLPAVPGARFVSGRMRSRNVVAAKAAQDSSESSSGSIVKYVQSSFSTPEDLFALAGIGFAGIAALWTAVNLVEVIDKLPALPLLFELIGILVAWFFIYQNLLFKPDRERFVNNVKNSISRVLGQ